MRSSYLFVLLHCIGVLGSIRPLNHPAPWKLATDKYRRAPAAGALNNITFNWTLTDMDTILQYTPAPTSASETNGWLNTFSDSTNPTFGSTNSVVGMGNSSHTTSLPNAYMTIQFVGTGIYLFGTGDDSSLLRLSVDGINADFSPSKLYKPLLGFVNKLPYGDHSAVLSSLGGKTSLQRVNIETAILSKAWVQ